MGRVHIHTQTTASVGWSLPTVAFHFHSLYSLPVAQGRVSPGSAVLCKTVRYQSKHRSLSILGGERQLKFLFLFKILVQKIVLLCTLYDGDDEVINFNVHLYIIIILLNFTKISFFL